MSDAISRLNELLSGRYSIERELGHGGMATVYLTADLKHGRRVALKVLSPEVVRSVGRDRFLREIDIVAKLAHPHILPLHDSGSAGDDLFYVMPFVEAGSLRARLDAKPRLSLSESIRFAGEIADGLGAAHRAGVIHRDLKPENILLLGGHSLVADFGVAALGDDDDRPDLTAVGSVIGSPAYMSPEQGAGDAIDARSDLYSLGCILFEMVSGVRPFDGRSARAVMLAHVSRLPPTLAAKGVRAPPDVERLVARALAKDRGDRFSSADEMMLALRAIAPAATDSSAEGSERATRATEAGPTRVEDAAAVRARGSARGRSALAVGGVAALLALILFRQAVPGLPTVQVFGTVVDIDGRSVPDVVVTFDGIDVQLRTDSRGSFVGELPRVDTGDVITLRATHPGYVQAAEVRRVDEPTEGYDVVLRSLRAPGQP